MFDQMQVPYERLMPTKPFTGVTAGTTTPIGQVSLPVTFGTRSNYRTELIDFDVANLGLPYKAILGYPALAKFMMVTHHAYNTVKLRRHRQQSASQIGKRARCLPQGKH